MPIGGFDFSVEDGHLQPDGRPAGTDLKEYNVDIKKSVITFSGSGGFAFAPLKDGWTVETVDPNSGLCRGDAKLAKGDEDANPPLAPQPSRTIHPVSFGTNGRDYPAGPATTPMVRGSWHLCATVPADNMEFLPEGHYHVGATFVAKDTNRPFPRKPPRTTSFLHARSKPLRGPPSRSPAEGSPSAPSGTTASPSTCRCSPRTRRTSRTSSS